MKRVIFLVVLALVACGITAQAQQVGTIHITAEVIATPITVTGGTLDFTGLTIGQAYKCPADIVGATIYPNLAGEGVAFGETEIDGDPNAMVVVTFGLPDKLYPTGGTGTGAVLLSYDAACASWGPSGAEDKFFDPRNSITMTIDPSGTLFLVLSANPTVPKDCGPDTYEGDAVITVSYVGAQ
jgi:hypothetical protein